MTTQSTPILLSPSPSRSGQSVPVSPNNISSRINIATRKQHTELNRLIVHRLSLALPPHANGPLLYGKGLIPFARIFTFFEIEWDLLTRQINGKNDLIPGSHDFQVRKWLAELRPEGMARTERIRADLSHMRFAAGPEIYKTAKIDEEWLTKMRILIRSRPHVLIAFAWVMYMAVFSGGRWIRQQLANAGPDFWAGKLTKDSTEGSPETTAPLELPGFAFLSFKGESDGEDIKSNFKLRLEEAETLLTSQEKQEVVDAAQGLFDCCIGTVYKLDRAVLQQKVVSKIWAGTPGLTIAIFLLFVLYRFWQ